MHNICEVVDMSPGSGYARGGRAVSGIWKALKQLNPANVRAESLRRIRVGVVGELGLLGEVASRLLGDKPEAYDRAGESFLLIATPSARVTHETRDAHAPCHSERSEESAFPAEILRCAQNDRNSAGLDPAALQLLPRCDVVLFSSEYRETLPGVATQRIFELNSADDLPSVIRGVLSEPDLAYAHLPLARAIPGFRYDVALRIIQNVSIENAIFVASTSLGNVIPNPLQPLASVAEGLGDLVVLTGNQLRMLFAIGAAYGLPVGYRNQAAEVGSIVAAAFGWRSIAREMVGKIPLGGGVVPKAAIAFAGTWAIGDGIVYFYTTGRKLTRKEIRERFEAAYEKGKEVAEQIATGIKDGVRRSRRKKNEPGV